MIFMSKAAARWATAAPMRPKPITPRVLPLQFCAFQFFLEPFTGFHGGIGARQSRADGEHQAKGQFGHGHGGGQMGN